LREKPRSGEAVREFDHPDSDSQQYSREVLRFQPGLLEKVMTQSANRVSERIVDGIRSSEYGKEGECLMDSMITRRISSTRDHYISKSRVKA
jgi:hypothetical protein